MTQLSRWETSGTIKRPQWVALCFRTISQLFLAGLWLKVCSMTLSSFLGNILTKPERRSASTRKALPGHLMSRQSSKMSCLSQELVTGKTSNGTIWLTSTSLFGWEVLDFLTSESFGARFQTLTQPSMYLWSRMNLWYQPLEGQNQYTCRQQIHLVVRTSC